MFSTAVPYGRGSRAHWSSQPTRTIVVFVHGFNGHATETWMQFDSLLADNDHDLLFYGYDSLRGRTNVMALQLLDCLEQLHDEPAKFVNGTLDESDHRPQDFRFDRMVIVAHSLGAVVARRMLLHAVTKQHAWVKQAELCFFAPAHKGAHVMALVSAAMSFFEAPLAAIARWRFPVLADLEENSDALQDLEEQTVKAIEAGAKSLAARLIVLSAEDGVVNTNSFCAHDDPGQVLPLSHTTICKPDSDDAPPFRALAKVLEARHA